VNVTKKQYLFIEALVGPAKGNATKAALMAGVPPSNARAQASRWMTKANIQAALAKRIARREEKIDITNERIDQELASIGFSKLEAAKDKNTSLKELNKVRGRHSQKLELIANIRTIEHLVVESRRLAALKEGTPQEPKKLKAAK
jgi:phage terminase small subunit